MTTLAVSWQCFRSEKKATLVTSFIWALNNQVWSKYTPRFLTLSLRWITQSSRVKVKLSCRWLNLAGSVIIISDFAELRSKNFVDNKLLQQNRLQVWLCLPDLQRYRHMYLQIISITVKGNSKGTRDLALESLLLKNIHWDLSDKIR